MNIRINLALIWNIHFKNDFNESLTSTEAFWFDMDKAHTQQWYIFNEISVLAAITGHNDIPDHG